MSKRRASFAQRDFISLIFSDENLTLSVCTPVYSQLERDLGSVSRVITDEELMLKLLSNFDLYASRIAQFFSLWNRNSINRSSQGRRRSSSAGPGIADELIEKVLFPLLGEDFQQFQLRPPFLDLFASITDFCLPMHPRPLEMLAKKLGEMESLLEALMCGENSTIVMREWINTFSISIFDLKIIGAWTRRLITQCQRCLGSHDIPELIASWKKLDDLIWRLTDILRTYPKKEKRMPSPEKFRKLDESEKKSGTVTQTQEPEFKLPPDVIDMLQYFGIEPPKSERTLVNALEKLERDKTLAILQVTIESFPCRTCFEGLTSPSASKSYDRYDTDYWGATAAEMFEGPLLFTELLGRGVGIWRVFVSSQALKDMQQAYVEGDWNQIESKLVQLASGDWQRKLLCGHAGGEGQDLLYQALYEKGGVLWQKDVEFDEESDTITQLVKVWRIGNVKEISQAIPHILCIHKTYPPARLDACKCVSIHEGTGRNLPVSFGGAFWVAQPTLDLEGTSDKNFLETLLQFNKFFMVTQTTIDNILSGNTNAEYPLVLSKEELEIIKNSKTSTLILGRSGTGKTTCLIYKLFGRYLVADRFELTRPKRQVLLTRSSVLSNKLKLYTKRLIATHLSGADSVVDSSEDPFNLLAQDEREVKGTIFSIEEKDFPLVCTFDHFMQLLENTTRSANRKDFSTTTGRQNLGRESEKWDPSMGSKRIWQRLYRRSKVVDYEVFSEEYWPSFPSSLTKHISVTVAFMEIIGVIKGSACRSTKFQPLTREEYCTHGHMVSPVLVDRDMVYDIYGRYERVKCQFGDTDDVDRARSVLEAISNNPELRYRVERAFDEIYVDEIQDQRLLEIKLLLHLIKRPNAIHFAGDTAQSISKDSVFRFQNVKDLLYEQFSLTSSMKKSPELAKPHQCELYKNYRTHQGILSVATSVMKLLYKCFPHMVDRLPDEEGQFSGPKPTAFVGFDATIFSSKMFGAVDLHANAAQFGAEQVIIVRDFAEKETLAKAIGDFALILTIMESKGMEFEDVLLYDFFATSKCIPAFRALAANPAGPYGEIDLALCSELKQLYVAITRAQNRLWFFESSEVNLAPIMGIWRTGKPIVEVAHINDGNIREKLMQLRPGTQADPKVWSTKGYEFIHKKDYENALFCFGRAGDSTGKSLATAFIAEKKGRALLASGDEDRSEKHFLKAIELFHECNHPLREASCYETLGMFKEAADIFSENGEFARAADLYNKIDSFEKAAKNYSRAGRYNEGAYTLARGNLFENLVYYLNDYGSKLDSNCRLHYSRLCNLLLKQGKIPADLKDLTVAALRTDSEKEDFFREYEMTTHLSSFYIDRGRYSDACNLAIQDGDLDKAWELGGKYGGIHKLKRQQRLEVFNYAQAKYLLANLATEPEQIFSPDANWVTECSWLSDSPSVLVFWMNLKRTINDLRRLRISYKSISFAERWMKQLFDIIVAFKAHAFISSASAMAELPIESINEVLGMVKEIFVTGTIPVPVLIYLRIFPIEQEVKSYIILDSSPLATELDPPLPSDATIAPIIGRWVLGKLCKAVDETHEKALELSGSMDPCVSVLTQGNKPPGRCKGYHIQVTSEKYTLLTNDVLRINSLFCNLLPLYNMRFSVLGFDDFWKGFRPRQRRWLENLLTRITYVSSVENAPRVISNTRRDISREGSPYFGIFGGLDDLLFFRLKSEKDWLKISDFSSMLEQIQVAEALGTRVEGGFRRSLALGFREYNSSEQSRKSWRSLQEIEGSLWFGIGQDSVRMLDGVIENIECGELNAYHAVASLYEKMATFLIYMSRPTDFLLPNGWVEMYMRQMPHLFSPKQQGPLQNPKLAYREALLLLIRSFCKLVYKVNSFIFFQHKLSGRVRSWRLGFLVFVHRNVCFLATCILNAFSWRTSQGSANMELHYKYSQTRTLVQKAFSYEFASSPELWGCPSENSLARKFVRSFDRCSGKDSLCVIKATSNTVSFFCFLDVPTILLEGLLPAVVPRAGAASNKIISPAGGESENYTQSSVSAAQAIQHMWRTRYSKVQARREYFKSPSGQAILHIGRICKMVLEGESLDWRERIWRRGILFSDGLDIYLHAKRIERLYLDSKEAVNTRINNAEASQMESFQFQWEIVSAIRHRVYEGVDFLSEKNWEELDIPSQMLSQKCKEVLRDLKNIEAELNMVGCSEREITAAGAIQQMWRRRSRIVQKRREFFKTPSGQAILYIHGIYKAILEEAPLDRKERVRRAAVLFTNGLDIYEYVRAVEKLYLRVKSTVRSRVAVRTVETELAQDQWQKVSEVRHDVRRNAGFLSEENWGELDIPSQELRWKFRETMTFLRSVEDDLHDIMDDGLF